MTDEVEFLSGSSRKCYLGPGTQREDIWFGKLKECSQIFNNDNCSAFYLQFILLLKISIFYLVAEKKDVVLLFRLMATLIEIGVEY